MEQILKSIDIMSSDIKLKIDKKFKFSTTIGGIVTIFLLFGFLILCGYFGKDLYYKVNPKYIQNSDTLPEHPFLNINNSNFFFAFRIVNDSNLIVEDLKYFEYYFDYTYYLLDPIIVLIKIL